MKFKFLTLLIFNLAVANCGQFKGKKGDQGPIGSKGDKGEQGEKGDRGDLGSQGLTGSNGVNSKPFFHEKFSIQNDNSADFDLLSFNGTWQSDCLGRLGVFLKITLEITDTTGIYSFRQYNANCSTAVENQSQKPIILLPVTLVPNIYQGRIPGLKVSFDKDVVRTTHALAYFDIDDNLVFVTRTEEATKLLHFPN